VSMTLSLGLPNFGTLLAAGGYADLLAVARLADDVGVHRVILTDHVVMGRNLDAYRWGPFGAKSETPWLEPLTVLATMAGQTSRIKLSTGILIAPLRGAAVLAKTAATLDVVSNGRLELGLGTGWQREEYEAAGLDFDRRGRLLTDLMEAMRALWQATPATVDTSSLTFKEIFCEPKPHQPGGIPLWVAGSLTPPVVERIVRWGDGWIPIMGSRGDDVAAGVELLRGAYEEAGRDPSTVQARGLVGVRRGDDATIDWSATLRRLERLDEIGVTDVQVMAESLGADTVQISDNLAILVDEFRSATATSA
jgi:probable F420-dependent oxidoreductase